MRMPHPAARSNTPQTILCAFLPLFLFLPATGSGQAQLPSNAPQIVIDGLEAYRRDGLRSAVAIWMKGSPAAGDVNVNDLAVQLGPMEAAYGKAIGHDILRVVPIGRFVKRVYAIIRYERGPLYAFFDCYESPTGWIVAGFLTHTSASEIVPYDMITGEDSP